MGGNEKAREDERDLIRRAKAYDASAFAEIYERYYQGVYTYVCYRVSDSGLAEDLTADVFVRALESIDTFSVREGTAFSAWLYRIANNLVIDYYRLRPREHVLLAEDSVFSDDDEPAEALDRKLTAERLQRALLHLTEDQRQVILLRFVDGFRSDQIAHVLGKSEAAVKSLQHRAVLSLSRILGVQEQ